MQSRSAVVILRRGRPEFELAGGRAGSLQELAAVYGCGVGRLPGAWAWQHADRVTAPADTTRRDAGSLGSAAGGRGTHSGVPL
jgi:hypothetical protein